MVGSLASIGMAAVLTTVVGAAGPAVSPAASPGPGDDGCAWRTTAMHIYLEIMGDNSPRARQMRDALVAAGVDGPGFLPPRCTWDRSASPDQHAPGQHDGDDQQQQPDRDKDQDQHSGEPQQDGSDQQDQHDGAGQESAASAFQWGNADAALGSDFDGAELSGWNRYDSAGHAGNGKRSPSQIQAQDGVLRMNGTADGTSGGMMGSAVQPKFGRWEVRMKVDKRGDGGAYHPVIALIPSGQAYNGGSGDLDFAETDAGSGEVYCFIHYNGKQDYLKAPVDLEQWHTYSIEVASDHITWFIDGKVTMTDTNSGAITGTPWTLNLQLDAYQPSGLAPSTMDVDYFRYFPLPDGSTTPPQGPTPQTSGYGG